MQGPSPGALYTSYALKINSSAEVPPCTRPEGAGLSLWELFPAVVLELRLGKGVR